MDDEIKKIFDESEKAEFLEFVGERLQNCRRCMFLIESPSDTVDGMDFNYAQLGFRQEYEVLGFLDWMKGVVDDADNEPD